MTAQAGVAPAVGHLVLVGIGIDEGTAEIVSEGELEVLGRGTVAIVAADSPRVRTLRAGMRVRYSPAKASAQLVHQS